MKMPTIVAADQSLRAIRGARNPVAINQSKPAAINIRTHKNVSGPASVVA